MPSSMTEALHDILATYLDVGYQDVKGFWTMTLPEIVALLESAKRRLKREQQMRENETRQQAIMFRNLSLQTGESVACLFDKNKRTLTPLSEYYPSLFKHEDEVKEMDIHPYTDLFVDWCERANIEREKKRNKRGGEANVSTGNHTEEVASSAGRQHCEVAECNEASGTADTE